MGVTWSIQTPTGAAGAIGAVLLSADRDGELDGALMRLGIRPVRCGDVALRNLCGVDDGIIARWGERSAHLMPHGGAAVMRGLAAALARAGFDSARDDVLRAYPEAASLIEARMLAALARAASPLAVDLLLDQPRRWESALASDPALDRVLNRLVDPPLVVAMGPANIGKSSLLNALAGRRVALVADEPGTTRDHVGALVDLAGLVVRYVDTPGLRTGGGAEEKEARRIAADLAQSADLVLRCGDATGAPVAGPGGVLALVVALRVDLGKPSWEHEVGVSAVQGTGLGELTRAVRNRLVPPAALADSRAWRFWGPKD